MRLGARRRRAGLHASFSGAEASRTALWRHQRDRLQPRAHRVDLGRTRRRRRDNSIGGMGGMVVGAATHRSEGLMAAAGSGRVRAGPALMSSAGGGTSSRGGAGLPIAAARMATPPKATAATVWAAAAAVAAT